MSRKPPPEPLPQTDDPYVLLDVRPGASGEQIRRAYLRRVKMYKPDRHPAEFRRVREAYDRLREQEKWLDAWRQAGEVIRKAVQEQESQAEGEEAELAAARAELEREGLGLEGEGEDEDEGEGEDAEGEGEARHEAPAPTFVDEPLAGEEPTPHPLGLAARVEALAESVHDALVAGKTADAAARLLTAQAEALASHEAFAPLLLEVCCAVVWSEPPLFDELVSRYGDLVSRHDAEFRHGALLHRRTLTHEVAALRAEVRRCPELERFVALGSSLRATAEAELGLRLGKQATADPEAFLQILNEAGRVAPGIVSFYVAMAERWGQLYGRTPSGWRRRSAPTADEVAERLVHRLRVHPTVRREQAQPLAVVALGALILFVAPTAVFQLLVIAGVLVIWALMHWRPNPLERLYLQVVQPVAAVWLWSTGQTADDLAAALRTRLPAKGSWGALLHPVDLAAYPDLLGDDLSLLAFGATGPMIPRLSRPPPR